MLAGFLPPEVHAYLKMDTTCSIYHIGKKGRQKRLYVPGLWAGIEKSTRVA